MVVSVLKPGPVARTLAVSCLCLLAVRLQPMRLAVTSLYQLVMARVVAMCSFAVVLARRALLGMSTLPLAAVAAFLLRLMTSPLLRDPLRKRAAN